IPASQVQPGDLVFFAGSDGTPTSPGHVGLVIGGGKMIEAYATGFPIRVAPYGGRNPSGVTRPPAQQPIPPAAAPRPVHAHAELAAKCRRGLAGLSALVARIM